MHLLALHDQLPELDSAAGIGYLKGRRKDHGLPISGHLEPGSPSQQLIHTHIYWWPQQRVLRTKWAGMLNQLCILGKDSSSSSVSQSNLRSGFFSLNKRCQINTWTWHPLYIRQELYKFPYQYVTTPTQSWHWIKGWSKKHHYWLVR